MLAKPLLLIILAACGVPSTASTDQPPTEQPDKASPKKPPQEGQHFCCAEASKGYGEGCGAISGSPESINICDDVLYCPGEWFKKDGNVTCVK
jgi:hypothetical protein